MKLPKLNGLAGQSLFSIGENVALLSGKLILILVILKYLGPASQGSFALFLTIQAAAISIAAFGLEPALMYWGARSQNHMVRRALFGNSLLTSVVSGIIAAHLVEYLSMIGAFGDSFNRAQLVALMVSVFLGTVSLVLSGLIGGVKRFDSRFLGVVIQNGLAIFGVVWTIFVVHANDALGMIFFFWAGGLCATAVLWCLTLRQTTGGVAFSSFIAKRQFKTAFQTYGYLLLSLAAMRIDVFVISHSLGLTELGFYSIATAGAELLLYLPKSIANPILVRSANAKTVFPYAELFRPLSALLLLTAFVGAILGPLVLYAFFSKDMHQVALLFLLLLPGTCLMGLGTTAAYALFGLHEMRPPLVASAAATVVKVVLVLAMVQIFGLAGAAIATSISYAVFAFITIKAVSSKAGLPITELISPDFSLLFNRLRVLRSPT